MTDHMSGSPSDEKAPQAHRSARPALHRSFAGILSAIASAPTVDLHAKSSNELAEIRTDLAIHRNLMGADRTLMAWIRTSLSLYSFGFTIYKLLEAYQRSGVDLPEGHTPRTIGLFLTGVGTLAMVMGVLEYWVTMRDLATIRRLPMMRPTFLMGMFMAALGLFLFFAIITKLF